MRRIQELYDQLHRTPFPTLGGVGDFLLYDSLIAGLASSASQGKVVPASDVPEPDEETGRFVADLRRKGPMTQEERAFLHYVDLLEEIRAALRERETR